MFASIWSRLGWKEELPPSPPPVTITGVRIPADGTPSHLIPLTTIGASGACDNFLHHIPDLRHYWNTDFAWECRDLHRIDLLQDDHIPQKHFLQQNSHLRRVLLTGYSERRQFTDLKQRYLLKQQYFIVPQHYLSCTGAYYMFFSFAGDYLPKNSSVPAWIRDIGEFEGSSHRQYHGDIFLVKMASNEHEENGWAAYEDIVPDFLDCLNEELPIRLKVKDNPPMYFS